MCIQNMDVTYSLGNGHIMKLKYEIKLNLSK